MSDITRFHSLPQKGGGQTFVVRGDARASTLEFGTYATRVAARLAEYGWIQSTAGKPEYTVVLSYQMGGSRERTGSVPIMGQTGGGTTFHSGSVSSYGGYSGYRSASYSGTSYTPATYGIVGTMPYSYTVHDRYMSLRITNRSGAVVFEGRANSTGGNSEIAAVLPTMIDSLFKDFPGESGKTKQVTMSLQ